jgi:hypothetical protein
MKHVTVFVCSCLITATTYAQSPPNDPRVTNSRMNGRLWLSLSNFDKSLYIQSIVEGVALSRDFVMNVNNKSHAALVHEYSIHVKSDKACVAVTRLLLTKVSTYLPNKEMAERVDKFYQPKDNLIIPIVEALGVVTAGLNGASEEETRNSELQISPRDFLGLIEIELTPTSFAKATADG